MTCVNNLITIFSKWLRREKNKVVHFPEGQYSHLSRIASVLSQRQLSGEVTRLRQIHKLTGLDQRETMKLIAELKSSGVLTVEENLSDVFESILILDERAFRHQIRENSKKAA